MTATQFSKLNRPPLICVHGFAQSAASWFDVAEAFRAKGYEVYLYELAGHGSRNNPVNKEDYRLKNQGKHFLETLTSFQRKPVVIAYSMGGRVVLHALQQMLEQVSQSELQKPSQSESQQALQYPSQRQQHQRPMKELPLRALVLESAGIGMGDAAERQSMEERDRQAAYKLRTEGVDAFMGEWEQVPLFGTQKELPLDVQKRISKERRSHSAEALARCFEMAGQHTMPERSEVLSWLQMASNQGIPLLYIAGNRDRKYSALAREIGYAVQGAQTEFIPGAGHNVHLEQPNEFVQRIDSFLCKL